MNNRAEVLENLGDYGSADFTVRKDDMFVSCAGYDTHVPNHKAIVRNDNDYAIAVVGKNYNPVNHPDAFKTAENVIMLSDLDIEGITRDVGCSHNGARAYATYTLPNHRVNLGREGDDVALTISARNSFDGSWSFIVEVGGYRFICTNLQVFANNFAVHKSKHTRGLNLQHVADKLSESVKFYDQETELWKEMVDTKITYAQAMSTLAHLANAKAVDNYLKSSDAPFYLTDILYEPDVIRNKTISNLWSRWINNAKSLDATAWALYNAMTEWATHEVPTRKITQKNFASVKLDRLDRVRKTLNEKMLPELKLVA
jgi:hypothetical protein